MGHPVVLGHIYKERKKERKKKIKHNLNLSNISHFTLNSSGSYFIKEIRDGAVG
jgi:hypothetical protein